MWEGQQKGVDSGVITRQPLPVTESPLARHWESSTTCDSHIEAALLTEVDGGFIDAYVSVS